jgi:hypothetical protein
VEADASQPAHMDPNRSALLGAAISGAGGVLLLASLFLNWYVAPAEDLIQRGGDLLDDIGGALGIEVSEQVSDSIHLTGWEAFEITDIVCVAAAAIAIVRAAVAIAGQSNDPDVPGAVLVGAFGAAALALIFYRTVNPPYVALDRELGLWLGLFAAGTIVYGAYVAMQARRSLGPSGGT